MSCPKTNSIILHRLRKFADYRRHLTRMAPMRAERLGLELMPDFCAGMRESCQAFLLVLREPPFTTSRPNILAM